MRERRLWPELAFEKQDNEGSLKQPNTKHGITSCQKNKKTNAAHACMKYSPLLGKILPN